MADIDVLIKECMDNIQLDKEFKEKIIRERKSASIENINKYNRHIYYGKLFKYATSMVACIMVFIFVSSVGIYALSGQNIWQYFFDNKGREYAKEIMDYNGQSYTIDDYTITLEQTLYDTRTTIGYCVFSIQKEGGRPEVKLNKWRQAEADCFGEEHRFHIEVFATGGCSTEYELVGDTLYAYTSFRVEEEFDNTINVIDSNQRDDSTIDGFRWYTYDIRESMQYKEYAISKTMDLAISPLGVTIDCYCAIKVRLVLHYNDGREEMVIDTEKGIGVGSSHACTIDEKKRYQFIFDEIRDIQNVDYIIFNGDKYE